MASWNLEDYILDLEKAIEPERVHDMGNLEMVSIFSEMERDLKISLDNIRERGGMPILMGGEHSISPAAVEQIRDKEIGIIIFDAHLDYRDEYLGEKHSHACVTRRISEIIGPESVLVVGARSACKEEARDAKNDGLRFISPAKIRGGEGHASIRSFAKDYKQLYLSVDMDAFDPGYAPQVGTPEPYGIHPGHCKKAIEELGPKLVAVDIVEGLGIKEGMETAMLGADFIRRVICSKGGKE